VAAVSISTVATPVESARFQEVLRETQETANRLYETLGGWLSERTSALDALSAA
jgi:hypothetical protein